MPFFTLDSNNFISTGFKYFFNNSEDTYIKLLQLDLYSSLGFDNKPIFVRFKVVA